MSTIKKGLTSAANDFIVNKDERTFKVLIDVLTPNLKMYLKRFTGNDTELLQDIMTQTFVNIWHKIWQYNDQWTFATWVYAIARNEALTQTKVYKHEITFNKFPLTYNPFHNQQDYYKIEEECYGPKKTDVVEYLYKLAIKEINYLDDPYKSILYERLVNKREINEISKVLCMNESTVKTRLTKAKHDINNLMKTKYEEYIETYHEYCN